MDDPQVLRNCITDQYGFVLDPAWPVRSAQPSILLLTASHTSAALMILALDAPLLVNNLEVDMALWGVKDPFTIGSNVNVLMAYAASMTGKWPWNAWGKVKDIQEGPELDAAVNSLLEKVLGVGSPLPKSRRKTIAKKASQLLSAGLARRAVAAVSGVDLGGASAGAKDEAQVLDRVQLRRAQRVLQFEVVNVYVRLQNLEISTNKLRLLRLRKTHVHTITNSTCKSYDSLNFVTRFRWSQTPVLISPAPHPLLLQHCPLGQACNLVKLNWGHWRPWTYMVRQANMIPLWKWIVAPEKRYQPRLVWLDDEGGGFSSCIAAYMQSILDCGDYLGFGVPRTAHGFIDMIEGSGNRPDQVSFSDVKFMA
jgi:hypothetical protein